MKLYKLFGLTLGLLLACSTLGIGGNPGPAQL